MFTHLRTSIAVSATILLAFVTACDAAPRRRPQQPPAATTEPAAPAGPRSVKISDAVALKDLETDDREAYFSDKLTPPQVAQTIYFGELDTYTSDDDEEPATAVPIIGIRDGNNW